MRVVQIEPGPMPTLMASAPASISACAPSRGGDIAGDDRDLVGRALDAPDLLEHVFGMAVRGVDDEAVDAGRHQQFGALETLVADRGRRGDAQAPVGVLGGVGMGGRLLDILDRDEADAFCVLVDDDQLLDPVVMQQAARLVGATPSPTVMTFFVMSSLTGWRGSSAKRTSRLVRMPTSLAGLPSRRARPRECQRSRPVSSAPARRRASRRGRS